MPLTKAIFFKMYFGGHNVYYKPMVHIARLLHELTLLYNNHFYQLEQQDYRVYSEVMQWQLEGDQS
jgi:5-methylcytosine-specific restriction enzyme subunit McrC